MDGMVEYSGYSPKDSRLADTFGDSSTFKFALTISASREEGPVTSTGGSLPASSGHGNQPTCPTESGPSMARLSAINSQQERQRMDSDVISALKSYLNQSSMEYLPQRHVASSLLEKYFAVVNPIWPLLIEEDTRAEFEKLWTSNDIPNPLWVAQLNLIFALACQLYGQNEPAPLANVFESGKLFYQRANGFIIANSRSLCNTPMVQTLLLAAQYEQGTMRSNECWITIGIATRMAMGLGLHTIADTDTTSMSPLDKELCRRLWWGCFSLDR